MSEQKLNVIESRPPPSNLIKSSPPVSNTVESKQDAITVITSNVGPRGIDGAPGAGSSVFSVFGRIGDIVGQNNDYSLGQIDGLRNDGVGQSFLADNGLYLQITAGVSSFAGRTGDVTTEAGDYSAFYDAIGASEVVQGNLSAHSADQTNPHVVTGAQVGLGNVDNTADADKPVSVASQAAMDLKEDLANKGLANGYTPLDAQGKISGDFLDITGLVIIGPWSAATNDPLLANGTGTLDDTYWATDAGTVDFGAGPINFSIGDYVVYTNANVWDRIPAAAPVTQVFGRLGAVVAASDDYALDQITGLTSLGNGGSYLADDGTYSIPSVITDWQDFAPVWKVVSGDVPSIGDGVLIGKYRRVGDTCEIRIGIFFGTTTDGGSGAWLWELPPGLVIDMTKMWRVQYARVGNASVYHSTTRELLGRPYQAATNSEFGVVSDVGNWDAISVDPWAAINIDCSWPIVGW